MVQLVQMQRLSKLFGFSYQTKKLLSIFLPKRQDFWKENLSKCNCINKKFSSFNVNKLRLLSKHESHSIYKLINDINKALFCLFCCCFFFVQDVVNSFHSSALNLLIELATLSFQCKISFHRPYCILLLTVPHIGPIKAHRQRSFGGKQQILPDAPVQISSALERDGPYHLKGDIFQRQKLSLGGGKWEWQRISFSTAGRRYMLKYFSQDYPRVLRQLSLDNELPDDNNKLVNCPRIVSLR